MPSSQPNQPNKIDFEHQLTTMREHRFLVMICGVIAIAGVMVWIAMDMYNTSGAAQVDLSRPGFQEVRKQAARDAEPETYKTEGSITKQSLDEFKKMYQQRRSKIADGTFDPNVLSVESLQLFSTNSDTENQQQTQAPAEQQ